jgi:hypothetical protein
VVIHFSDVASKQKSMLPKANEQREKKTICQTFHKKKIQKVLMKIEEMADVFLNSDNFASHALLTLAPPSGYALNLIALMCQTLAEHLCFHMKYLDLHFKKDLIRQTSFLQKKPSQKPRSFRVKLKHTDVLGSRNIMVCYRP